MALPLNPVLLLVDDHSIIRTGVQLLLQLSTLNAEADEAENGNAMLDKLKQRHYDLVILDINMPDTDTNALLHYVLVHYPDIKVLIFSMSPEEIYGIRYLQMGVQGFLSKDAPKETLLKAIETVLAGDFYFSPKIIKNLTEHVRIGSKTNNVFEKLSAREFEVMTHLIKGKSVKEISAATQLHSSTIGTHKARIYKKLNVINLLELKKLADIHNMVTD